MGVETVQIRQNLGSGETTRKPSPAIWADCPWESIGRGDLNGIAFYDDFNDLPLFPTLTTQIAYGKYKAFANTSATLAKVTTINSVEVPGGALQMGFNANNDGISIGQAQPSFFLSGLSSTSGKLWFEACIAQSSIATNMISSFVGLFEVDQWTLANTVPLNAGDPINNGAAGIGFRLAEDGLGVIDTVVTDRATSFTNIGAGEGGTLVANTFKKVGFVYDPYIADNTLMIKFYTDNLIAATKYTKTNITATTNLKANALGLLWAAVADSAVSTNNVWLKWWRCAQVFDSQV